METKKKNVYDIIFIVFALIVTLYHLYTALFGIPLALQHRFVHIAMMLVIVFVLYSFKGKRDTKKIGLEQIIFFALIAFVSVYFLTHIEDFLTRFPYVSPLSKWETIVGTIVLILVLEATRRSIGPQLPIVALVFIAYALFGHLLPGSWALSHRRVSFKMMLDVLYLGLDGMWSEPVAATSTYVFLFTLFASFLIETKVGNFFNDFAITATRKSRGGAAKTAVIASALMGTISGASTANVVATGSFTIPLMKETGYEKDYAGAVEAVASTGGQIMPPVMGVAAFIMVEITGISYSEIVASAIVPAMLYFLAVFMMVHFHALKNDLKSVAELKPENFQYSIKELLLKKGHLFIPMIVIFAVLMLGRTAQRASFFGIIATLAVAMILKETRPTLKGIIHALVEGAVMVAPIACACACAGIVMGMIQITGLGFKMMNLVVALSHGHVLPALLLSMLAAIILGMGVPTSAAYIIMATMLAPAIVNMGIPVIVAHMFVFYFACISSITPPVALAAYAAAGISGGDPVKTGFNAMRLGIMAFIVPFMFVYVPGILLLGSTAAIIRAVVSSIIAVIVISAGLEGYCAGKIGIVERALLLASGAGLLTDSYLLMGLSLILAAVIFYISYKKKGNAK